MLRLKCNPHLNHALISVHTDSSEARDQAKKIFEQAHAEDISSTGEEPV